MFVGDILSQARDHLLTINATATVKQAADLLAAPRADMLTVCRDGVLVGVVSKRDIIAQISRGAASCLDASIETIMTRDVASCRTTDALADVLEVMKSRGLQRVPIVDEKNGPVGVVYAPDALQRLLTEIEIDDELLREFISGVGYH